MLQSRNAFASLTLIFAMAIWGSSFVAFKFVLEGFTPLQAVAFRMLTASLVFSLFLPLILQQQIERKDIKFLILMSLAEPCIYFMFEAWALKLTTASEAGVVTAMLPLIVAVLAGLILGEQVRKNHLAGILLTVPGVIWLTFSGSPSDQASNPMLGNFLEFIAMVSAAFYTIILKSLSARYSSLFLTAFQSVIGLLFFMPIMLLVDGVPDFEIWPANLGVLYLGVVVTLGGYGIYNFSVRFLPATQVVMFSNLIPVFTLLFAFLILDEHIRLSQWYAVALIIGGVVVSQISFRPTKAIEFDSADISS
ncbi:DMT family transporter [Gynuella sunshinyii]|uniref:Putative permease n=1 Tax=Gynuella sunshinyii YC6258 TaxID=1445510 RepID=A0A0C5VSX6_9GAMM|nr:DMT family transporter [Gynuella sunshinyii]AJQ97286.1 putative permease [Gynuella sunshinyii YC6258]